MKSNVPISILKNYETQIESILFNYELILLDMRRNPDTQRILSIELQNPYHYEYFDKYIKSIFTRFDVRTAWMRGSPESPYRMVIYVYPKGIRLDL